MKTRNFLFLFLLAALLTLSLSVVSAQDTVVITWWHISTVEDQQALW